MGGISVVVTVLNDREGLERLLEALAAQERPADEIVVVDGGSTDGTLEAVDHSRFDGLPVRVVRAPDANISAGRNVGVEAATHEWIACTDAGCRPRPGWLAAIDAARRDADFVAGVYTVDCQTAFERALAVALYPSPDEIGGSGALVRLWQRIFGRSFAAAGATGRSMAFSKRAWRSVDGFPEHLFAGEDVTFSRAVVRSGWRARLDPGAVVDWRPRRSWRANARMYAVYARGGVRGYGGGRSHLLRVAGWALAAGLAASGRRGRIAVLCGASAYASVPLARARRAGFGPAVWWRVPLVIALKDLAQIAGAAAGVADQARGLPQAAPGPGGPRRGAPVAALARRRGLEPLVSSGSRPDR